MLLAAGFARALDDSESRQPEAASASIYPVRLRCDYAETPLAVQSQHPRLSWNLQAREALSRGLRQTAYQILIASSADALSRDEGRSWDSGKVESERFIQVQYAGEPLASNRRYFWKVRVWDQEGAMSRWSEVAAWSMGLLQPKDWHAQWIAAEADRNATLAYELSATAGQASEETTAKPLPIFRRVFHIEKRLERAIVYVCGLGQYELRLNGRKVGEDALSPSWTDYRKRVLYDAYDVTDLLRSGDNALGMMLGNGMYNVELDPRRYTKFVGSMGDPKLIVQLNVRYSDGSDAVLASNRSWRWIEGPVILSSTYGGEDYDARKEPPGWDTPGFDDSNWHPVVEVDGPGGKLISRQIPPIRVMQVYRPLKQTEPSPGTLVYDLGQNFSGWPQIEVSGPAGSSVKIIPGELLDPSGRVTQKSSGSPAYFTYFLRGIGHETWHPRFSYYGFRYLQVESRAATSGAQTERPVLEKVEAQFVYSSAPVTGEFSSSDVLLNHIHGLIDAAVRSNMQSVLTDCPHREKLGWLEESYLLGAALMYNFDLSQLFTKIADDTGDSQLPNGLVPDIAPEYVVFQKGFRDSPEWGSAAVLDPWLAYQFYGDRKILSQHYDVMHRYVDYLSGRAQGHILSYGLGDWYDIGPRAPGESQLTSRGVTATAIYYLDLTVLRKAALLIGRKDDAVKYERLAEAVRAAFNAKLFHDKTNQYDTGSQTANAIPLAVGLVPSDRFQAVLKNLVQDIRAHNNHVTAGDVGFHFVVRALTDGGRSDVLYDMLSRTDSPSYGYQLARGATTLTEAWDTNPESSQNHFMLGHAEDWFYRGLSGIDFDLSRPTQEHIVVRPSVVAGVDSAGAAYDSILGKIEVHWFRNKGQVSLEVTIPPGASATVYAPSTREITESGGPLCRAASGPVSHDSGNSVFRVGSGRYHFVWPE